MNHENPLTNNLITFPKSVTMDDLVTTVKAEPEASAITLSVTPEGVPIAQVPVQASPELVALAIAGARGYQGFEYEVTTTVDTLGPLDIHTRLGVVNSKNEPKTQETTTKTTKFRFIP